MAAGLSPAWRAAIGFGVASQALFAFRVATPHKLVFDEVHYVPAARALLALSGPVNIEHPLLGKALIALGIRLFGDNSLGWRLPSTIAGTATVIGVFALLWLAFGRLRTAALGAALVMVNFTVFIQARIAMLDGFMAAFVVTGLVCLLWATRGPRLDWNRWVTGSVLLGLAVATKWTALPMVGFAGLALIVARSPLPREAGTRPLRQGPAGAGAAAGMPPIPAPATALLVLLGTVAAVYLASFFPAFFYASEPMTLGELLPFQARMYAEQTQVLPPHTYQSSWWSWPLMIRPIWYLYEPADGAVRGILMLGNPAILWGGLVAVLACLDGWRHAGDRRLLAAAGLWLCSIAMWIVIPKSIGFFYYYYLGSIFLCVAIAAALDRIDAARVRPIGPWFLIFCTALFGWFYPILSATALAGPQSFLHWMWFTSWR